MATCLLMRNTRRETGVRHWASIAARYRALKEASSLARAEQRSQSPFAPSPPIVVIGIVQWILLKDGSLGQFVLRKGLPIAQISSLRETASVLEHMATLAPLHGEDSWWPMHLALQALGGAKKDVLYEMLHFQ